MVSCELRVHFVPSQLGTRYSQLPSYVPSAPGMGRRTPRGAPSPTADPPSTTSPSRIGWGGCSSKPPAEESKKAGTAPDKIQGKVQVLQGESTATDIALNAGGPSVYLWEGVRRYRLFFRTPIEITPGKEYIAEGVNAQRVIDEIGDPDQGKNGYPLQASCERVVNMAWSGLAFDVTDGLVSVLRTRVKRYPARPVFLVMRLTPVEADAAADAKKAAEAADKDIPEVAVAADKQRALRDRGRSGIQRIQL